MKSRLSVGRSCSQQCAGDAEIGVGGVAKVAEARDLLQINEVGFRSSELFYYKSVSYFQKKKQFLMPMASSSFANLIKFQ